MGPTKNEQTKIHTKSYGSVVLTLRNQLLPEEKLMSTPSLLDGLDRETETDLRIYGCELIQTAGILLNLPQVAMATGQVLLQRFYYSKSLVRHPVEQTAMACICLASKIEEAPRRARDVINVFNHIKQVTANRPITPVILDQNYIQLKNQVIKAERRVLKELGFCVHIKHPHKIIVMYLQVLGYEKHHQLMQYSWNYMNDSLRTDVFVRYQPETVACACIYLTARKLKMPLPRNPAWYSLFGVLEEDIKDVCIRILKLYNRSKINVEMLERKVEDLVKRYQEAKIKARNCSGSNTPINNYSPSSPTSHKTAAAHNAWGGFIRFLNSRSGSHIAPSVTEKRSRSRSATASPVVKHHKRSKKHARSRSRSPRNHKKHKKARSYSRSRSNSPHVKTKKRDKRRSRSTSNERYIDRYEKNDRYEKYSSKEDRDRDRYEEKAEKKERHEKTSDKKYEKERDEKYREDKYREEKYREEKYEKEKYKKSKHRGGGGGEDEKDRSKDRRR